MTLQLLSVPHVCRLLCLVCCLVLTTPVYHHIIIIVTAVTVWMKKIKLNKDGGHPIIRQGNRKLFLSKSKDCVIKDTKRLLEQNRDTVGLFTVVLFKSLCSSANTSQSIALLFPTCTNQLIRGNISNG